MGALPRDVVHRLRPGARAKRSRRTSSRRSTTSTPMLTTSRLERALDQARPVVPGETRVYDGPAYLDAPTRPGWTRTRRAPGGSGSSGLALGGLVALGVVLAGQRRPRVSADDDFRDPGRAGRVESDQRRESSAPSHRGASSPRRCRALGRCRRQRTDPRRFVVTGPVADPAVPTLAIGLAVELEREGCRVVLVDASGSRTGRMLRLAAPGWARRCSRRGLAGVIDGRCELATALRRVHRWQVPRSLRRRSSVARGELRFLSTGGRRSVRRRDPSEVRTVLERLDESVCVVVLAPPVLTGSPRAGSVDWGDAVAVGCHRGAEHHRRRRGGRRARAVACRCSRRAGRPGRLIRRAAGRRVGACRALPAGG